MTHEHAVTVRTPAVVQLCGGSTDKPLCMNVAAWHFEIAGRPGVPPVAVCFDCVDDWRRRATAGDLPVNVTRIQPRQCQNCGDLADDGIARVYFGVVGPFCRVSCRDRWVAGGRS